MDDKGLYIVTGATGGIGRALTEGLCRKGLRVVMACRNMEKAEAVRQGIMRSGKAGNGEITVRTLDMASLGSIGRFAEELRSEGAEIAALVNNAGVMSARFGLTADGIEQCMGVNYVGPYALTRLLLPMIADGGRIVNTLSVTYRIGRIGPRLFEPEPQRYERFRSYGSSKLALLLFTLELARRTAGRTGVYAADPGMGLLGRLLGPFLRYERAGVQAFRRGRSQHSVPSTGRAPEGRNQAGRTEANGITPPSQTQKGWFRPSFLRIELYTYPYRLRVFQVPASRREALRRRKFRIRA